MDTANPLLLRNFSLTDFQDWNRRVYLIQNDVHFCDTSVMVSRMMQQAIRLHQAAEENIRNAFSYRLAMTFSWTLAFANRRHFVIQGERLELFIAKSKSLSLRELQVEIARPHELPSPACEVVFLLRQIGVLTQVFENFRSTHSSDSIGEIEASIVGVVVKLCRVAASLDFDLAAEMERQFPRGCNKCRKTPCDCQFSVDKQI